MDNLEERIGKLTIRESRDGDPDIRKQRDNYIKDIQDKKRKNLIEEARKKREQEEEQMMQQMQENIGNLKIKEPKFDETEFGVKYLFELFWEGDFEKLESQRLIHVIGTMIPELEKVLDIILTLQVENPQPSGSLRRFDPSAIEVRVSMLLEVLKHNMDFVNGSFLTEMYILPLNLDELEGSIAELLRGLDHHKVDAETLKGLSQQLKDIFKETTMESETNNFPIA